MSRAGEWDVVVAGAGHNSLLTAAYAARAGFKVLVLEGAPRIGGDTTCEELTLPGFIHDPCATAHNLIQTNPLVRNNELQLDQRGLRYLYPDPVFTMPFRDGRSITMWRELDRTCAELARFSRADADAYRALLADWQSLSPIVNAERENPPRPPDQVTARTRAGPLGERGVEIRRATALDVIAKRFKDEHVRAFFAWIAFMTLAVCRVVSWTWAIWAEISPVARLVWSASDLTSAATTAKPRPDSPARAASIVALSASRLVWDAMSPIRPTIFPILTVDSVSDEMTSLDASTFTTASDAT